MRDEGIVRNRMKIEGAVESARAWLKMMEQGPGFAAHLWGFVDGEPIVNRYKSIAEIPVETEVSRAISKDLKSRGFKFCGPTIIYAFMQATGMVNDHLLSCHRHAECIRLARRR
jgi:DNA-3-methyladenine glycosylase I